MKYWALVFAHILPVFFVMLFGMWLIETGRPTLGIAAGYQSIYMAILLGVKRPCRERKG